MATDSPHNEIGSSHRTVDASLDRSKGESVIVNASGHVQEVERNFSLISTCAVGLTVGNVWPAVGGAILTAIYNGGAPGVLYEFIAVSVFYWLIAASIAELASAIPSSGAVYHWASVTPGRTYGPVVGFFAGYWNWLAWLFGCASMSYISANMEVQMYALTHPDFVAQSWHVFVAFLITTWSACAVVCFGNRTLPTVNNVGMFFILVGFVVVVVLCAVMPAQPGHAGHASDNFVWKEWSSDLGYSTQGFVFLMGMLNGAYAVGTPDVTTHLAEEIPNAAVNLPKAILAQMAIGFVTGFTYLIVILYGISDLDALYNSSYPLAEIYRQAAGSDAAAVACLVLTFMPILTCVIGGYITCGRSLWTLARDGATPFASFLGHINTKTDNNPFNATIVSGVLMTCLGAIYMGSVTAFNALIGSFVILGTASYIAAILPNIITGRRHIRPGPFAIPGVLGTIVNSIAVAYMLVFIVIFCFPYSLPATAGTMNYASLIFGGCTILVAIWWFASAGRKGSKYRGPPVVFGGEANPAVEKAKGHKSLDIARSGKVDV